MERVNALGVKKGAWSKEEDARLKKCIEQFGEGRWHLVPLRTGLNRCRKSCRLRWLNYLRPDITRGKFTKDEIDLLIRLHKLLGNRWSLIAGRIPGRTANDIKNFWNSRMEKKSGGGKGQPNQENISIEANIIRPRPHNFSTLMIHDHPGARLETDHDHQSNNNKDKLQPSSSINASLSSSSKEAAECIRWWSNLIDTAGDELEKNFPFVDDKREEKGLCTGSKINPVVLKDDGSDLSMPPKKLYR